MQRSMRMSARIASFACILALGSGCTSISQIGTLGPKELQIWKISDDDWLASSRMLVVTDAEGNLLAASGGTTAGIIPTGVNAVQAAATTAAGVLIGRGLTELGKSTLGVKGTVQLKGP